MGLLNKPLWAILGLLALGLAVSVSGALYFRGEARSLRSDLSAAQADLKGLEFAMAESNRRQTAQAALAAAQSDARAKQAQAVRAVRSEIQKEPKDENDSHVASPDQLGRLRRLVEAGNAGIHSASIVP